MVAMLIDCVMLNSSKMEQEKLVANSLLPAPSAITGI